jgi:hypothetical protein
MNGTRDTHLLEYEKLKEEQGQRIHFRDNMRYVTLAAIGLVAAQAGRSSPELWLVIPWICVVLGWNYVANVRCVTAIGEYIEETLREAVSTSGGGKRAFGWETRRREVAGYLSRRIQQVLVDEITFFVPGVTALVIFGLTQSGSVLRWLLAGVEAFLCAWIGAQIYGCADDRAKDRLRELARSAARTLLRRQPRVPFAPVPGRTRA